MPLALHEGHFRSEVVTEIGPALAHFLKRLQGLFGGSVLEHVACGTDFERAADDDRIAMHGEHKNRCALIVKAKPADEGQTTKPAGAHGEIDDDHIGALLLSTPASSSNCLQPCSTMG